MTHGGPIRLLLVGRRGTELRLAAAAAAGAGAQVTLADEPGQALALLRAGSIGLVMMDVSLDVPGFLASLRAERFVVPVLACGIDAPAADAVAAIRAGACDYVPLPPDRDLIAAAIAAALPEPAVRMVGESPALLSALAYARATARSRAPMLVVGEAGTGKQVLARMIHRASGRPGRFVTVECAGLPDEVIESDLFGHEAGAFRGAVARRTGRLEEAAEGTCLLRNIDRLGPQLQARLLAALRDGTAQRLGGREPIRLSMRLIASTSRRLEASVAEGLFRADLLARLNLVRIGLPALRERRDDLPLLAGHFVDRLSASHGLPRKSLGGAAMAMLQGHPWPGNVRELEDVVHRALLLEPAPVIGPEAIVLADGSRIRPARLPAAEEQIEVGELVGRTVEEVERALILRTLERCRGNRTSASSVLGISVRTMRNKLKTFVEAGIPVSPAL